VEKTKASAGKPIVNKIAGFIFRKSFALFAIVWADNVEVPFAKLSIPIAIAYRSQLGLSIYSSIVRIFWL
jgi:hypothetical protein